MLFILQLPLIHIALAILLVLSHNIFILSHLLLIASEKKCKQIGVLLLF